MASSPKVRYGCSECAKSLRAKEREYDLLEAAFHTLQKDHLTLSEAYDSLSSQHGISFQAPAEIRKAVPEARAASSGAKDVDNVVQSSDLRQRDNGLQLGESVADGPPAGSSVLFSRVHPSPGGQRFVGVAVQRPPQHSKNRGRSVDPSDADE